MIQIALEWIYRTAVIIMLGMVIDYVNAPDPYRPGSRVAERMHEAIKKECDQLQTHSSEWWACHYHACSGAVVDVLIEPELEVFGRESDEPRWCRWCQARIPQVTWSQEDGKSCRCTPVWE